MNLDHNILTIILLTPLVGAAVLALLPDRGKLQPAVTLAVTLLTFLLTLHLPMYYARATANDGFRFVSDHTWIAAPRDPLPSRCRRPRHVARRADCLPGTTGRARQLE